MDTGLVKRFFTEQPDFPLENGQTMEQALQTLATPTVGDGGSIRYAVEGQTEGSMSGAIESKYRWLENNNKLNGRVEPAITYRDLMQHAVRHGIVVYCYDVKVDPVRGEGGRRRPEKLSDEQTLAIRNEYMAKRYLNTPEKSFPGTLLLGGSDHFNYAKSKGPHLLDLTKLDSSRYIECD